MKLIKRACGVIFSVVFCFALASFSAGCFNLGGKYSSYNSKAYSVGNGTAASNEVSEIEVDWVSGNVVVDVSDSVSEITFSETYSDADEEILRLHYCVQNQKLSLKFAESKAKLPPNFQKDLTITLPGAALDFLDIDIASGSVCVKNILAKEAEFDTASADVDLRNVTIGEVETDTASGKVEIRDAYLIELSVDTASGNVNITDSTIQENLSVGTASGSVNIIDSAVQDDLSTNTASGDICVSNTSFREANIDTVSGNTDWYPISDKGFWCEFESVSGDFSSAFDLTTKGGNSFYFGSEQSYYGMKVNSVSGDFSISRISS